MIAGIVTDVLMTAAGLIAFAVAVNLRRRPREPAELEPNCVLTRYPVDFWTGRRTIFHFRETWGGLPVHLAAHGYDARTVRLPWSGAEARRAFARRRLESPRHLVLDWATAEELEVVLRERPPLSLTVIDPVHESAVDRFCFALHRLSLRATGPTLRPRKAVAGDPRARLLEAIRRLAEDDWAETTAGGTEFPLEGTPAT